MKFENLKKSADRVFRRITGVKRNTFNKMVEIVENEYALRKSQQKSPGGRTPNLSVENMVLMTLEYLREYRTYAHVGISYGLSETRTYETIRLIESILIKSKMFRLPGKKALTASDNEIEVILIDATETPIERPKKNSENIIREKRSATL